MLVTFSRRDDSDGPNGLVTSPGVTAEPPEVTTPGAAGRLAVLWTLTQPVASSAAERMRSPRAKTGTPRMTSPPACQETARSERDRAWSQRTEAATSASPGVGDGGSCHAYSPASGG